jgi:hypothetical protein
MSGDGDHLEVSWSGDDGDGVGRLTVAAVANGFSGRTQAWFNRETITQFAEELSRYPLDARQRPRIEGGFGGEPTQTHVALSAYPVGNVGQVAIGVDLASELWPDDRIEAQHRVRLELPTTYERLGAFARELLRLTDRNDQSGRIEAERLVE